MSILTTLQYEGNVYFRMQTSTEHQYFYRDKTPVTSESLTKELDLAYKAIEERRESIFDTYLPEMWN